MKLKRRNKAKAEFNMASLTDIIFLLLIFFVINSEMPNALKILLPNATGKAPVSKNIILAVSEDLRYMINNEEVSFNGIKGKLSSEIDEVKANKKEASVILKIDKAVELEHVVNILQIGNDLKVAMVLSTKPTKK